MSKSSRERTNARQSNTNALRKAAWCLVGILMLAGMLTWFLRDVVSDQTTDIRHKGEDRRHRPADAENEQVVVSEIAQSPFRNASKSVGYVGSGQCKECHLDEHKTYLETTHSRSMSEVDVSREPPDGEYYHELSGRHYRISREGQALRLREFIQDASGREVVLVDHAARFALGSGNYARMYLVKVDDFVIEAPVTWYPRRKTWDMSAGYEKDPHQVGFGREIDSNCLHCHSGRVEMVDNVALRLNVTEMAIGCERCHGPGALHVKERKAQLPIQGSIDHSIVNLRHLSRERQEDVCAQCHLSGSADVSVRGRSKADFRPGLRLSDFVVSYRVDRPESEMTVSGQIQQMRLSRCYIGSKKMTCATCHDPHSVPDEVEKVEYYRNKCLTCHQTESCGLPVKDRLQKQANDHCVICHMPRGPTDIPHFSFTHHRIGIHAPEPKFKRLTEADQLVAIGDISHLPEHERSRLLGLANDIFAGKLAGGLNDESRDDPAYLALSEVFVNRGRQLLEGVQSQGVRDPEIETFFSRMSWRKDPDLCISHAESALKLKQISPATRSFALYYLASSHFDQQRFEKAFPYLEELVKIERSEITLMLLAICHVKKGNLPEAVILINKAIHDAPDRADLHIYLASVYQKMGKQNDAESHLRLAKLLSLKVPQPK